MNILEIIAKKRDKEILTKEEIEFFVNKYTSGEIADYQAAALIMAIYINGMNDEETTNLTMAMANSGSVLDLSSIGRCVVDKHSTGGVGDKVTLILTPIIAALGIPVAKMSGRGLGVTGGTIDKLKSIPGYNTEIDINKFIENIKEIGISIISQTLNLAPADKKIYALRDTINCTESIPLIASSIMSKKIAAGADKIVLDVTCGSGAFMKNMEDAIKLSKQMKEIGNLVNKETVCIITNMDEPLGYSVGNNLEVIETIESLKGNIPNDVCQVVQTIGAYIIKLAGMGDDIEKNKQLILDTIKNGKGFEKFKELVKNQGGDISYIENIGVFPKSKYIMPLKSDMEGYVQSINAFEIGETSRELGAGRIKKEDIIENEVGIVLNKKVGDYVKQGEIIAYVHANDDNKLNVAIDKIKSTIKIDTVFKEKNSMILGIY